MPIVLLFLFKMAVAICSMKRRHSASTYVCIALFYGKGGRSKRLTFELFFGQPSICSNHIQSSSKW